MKRPVLPSGCFALLALVVFGAGSLRASPFDPALLDAHAAGKRLAEPATGESRLVRLFYILPEGRDFREEVVQKLKDEMLRAQAWFGEQMEAHGFGYKTFRIETDDEGEPLVHLPGEALTDAPGILVHVIDNGSTLLRSGVAGEATLYSKVGGSVRVPSEFRWDTLAHELAHAFGMGHDFRDETYILSYGQNRRNVLSECAARFLAVDPQFNPDVGVEWGKGPAIELLSPRTYPEGAQSVPIRLKVSDPQGLHMLRLRVPTRWTHNASISGGGWELKLCRDLMGAEEAVVEIDYDGVIPSGAAWNLWDLSDPKVHLISLTVMDRDGNSAGLGRFDLWEVSRQHLATFELAGQVHAVAFAPEGRTLASGSAEGIRVWDLETRTGTATNLSGGATAVALSPDGGTLASANPEGEVQLLDLASDQVVATLSGHTPPIRSLAFSPDGALLAAGAADAIRLWDLAAQTSSLLPVEAAAVAFSPDGTRLVSGSEYGVVSLWDLATRTDVRLVSGAADRGIQTVAFSPAGTLVAAGGDFSLVELWDVATGQSVAVLEGQGVSYGTRPVRSVAFSPDGTLLAFGLELGVNVWDPTTKRHLATLQGEGREINTVAFSPDRTTLAAGTQDGRIGLWDVSEWLQPRPATLRMVSGQNQQDAPASVLANPFVVEVRDQYGRPLPKVEVTFEVTAGEGILGGQFATERVPTDANGRAEAVLTLGPDPGDNWVEATAFGIEPVTFRAMGVGTPSTPAGEGEVHTWHLPTGATARLGKGRMGRGDRTVVFSPDGRLLAVGTHTGIWLYEVATSREVGLLPTRTEVLSLAFSPDGTTLASGEFLTPDADGMVRLWDLATGTSIATIDSPLVAVNTHASGLSLAFSPDGATLAVSSKNGVKFWDRATESILATTYNHRGTGWQAGPILALSADGTVLASGADDGTIRLWDTATGDLTVTLEGHTASVTSLSFSPDGTVLASASDDHTVRLWDTATGDLTVTLERHTSWVYSVAFSSDGTRVASGSADDTIRLWDAATGENTALFEIPIGLANSVAFSPDGTTLASFSKDGTVKVWDLATGNARTVGKGHAGTIWSLALSPDGTRVASGHGSGTIRLWDVASGTQTAQLKGHDHRINSLVFSSDGTTLFSGSSDNTIRTWDVTAAAGIVSPSQRMDAEATVTSLALAPDGTRIASGQTDGTATLWDVATGAPTPLQGHTYAVDPLVFSSDGATLASGDEADLSTLLASGSSNAKVRLWDVATATQTATYDLETDWILDLSFSPAMTPLVLGGTQDGTAGLWDLATATRISTIPGWWILAGALSPDQSMFVFGFRDMDLPTVELWDLGTDTHTATLQGHYVDHVDFSSDGSLFATGSRAGTVLVWDVQRVLPHPRALTKVAGDNQQGLPDSTLAEPLVVSVRDQNGNPFVGATVTFAVTAGGGTLSATTATTDETGRAAVTLTLGNDPGRNTVTARVPELNPVIFGATGQRMPRFLGILSGDEQEGPAGTPLASPFVIEVRDQNGDPLPGIAVTFAVTAGGGTLSATTATTDETGRIGSILTLGNSGVSTVSVTVAGLESVTFTATARATADFDGDGETGFSDFFLFADAFGGTDPRFDLDVSGSVDFVDFFLFADYFVDPARGKLMALAAELIGLPDSPQLQQNHPNPFNSETVISWFQLTAGPARVEVFALTGQRVAVLHQGPTKAGMHRVHWNGRDDQGRPVASGVHLYRLVTDEGVHTCKLTLLR